MTKIAEALMRQFTTVMTETMKIAANPWSPPEPSPGTAHLFELQWQFMGQFAELYTSAMIRQLGGEPEAVATPAADDKRFGRTEWQETPGLDLLKQSYLIMTRHIMKLVDATDLDDKARDRLRFFTRQFIDAASPANLLAANPEVLELARETNGASLAKGFSNLIDDALRGRIKTTDEEAFQIGTNIALTPGAVVYENDIFQLIQYGPLTEKVRQRPLLIVPPCINKFYILDLQPDNSLARYAVEEGNTTFMVSWRNVTEPHGHLTWDDYVERAILKAIDVVCEIAGTPRMNLLGFCVGGTMSSCGIAIMRARGENKVATLTLLAAMVDFSDTGEIGLLVDETSVSTREKTIGENGILPSRDLAFVFSSLRANDLIWPYVINNYMKGTQPAAFDLLFWNADSTNLPGPWYCWYMRNCYLENNVRVPGRMVLGGTPVDIGKIDMPTYLLATREDHIVPWRTAFQTSTLVSGPVRFVLGASGHVAGIVNPAGKNKRSHWIDGTLGIGAEGWLETATSVPGSWWRDWGTWMSQQPDKMVAARKRLGKGRYKEIEPAPGRYVKKMSND